MEANPGLINQSNRFCQEYFNLVCQLGGNADDEVPPAAIVQKRKAVTQQPNDDRITAHTPLIGPYRN